MKKKKGNKVEQVEAQVKEVKPEQVTPQRKHPFSAWDHLMFMRRKPVDTMSQEGNVEEKGNQ